MKKITMNIAGVALASVFAAMTAAQAATGTWTGVAGATWDTSASNWSGVTGTPWDSVNGTNNIAKFNTAGATPSVSGTVYANQLAFTNTATVSGGTITMGGANPTITVYGSGSESQIASSLAGADFIKAGSGTLILTGNSAAGMVKGVNNGGTLVLSNGGTMINSGLSNIITVGSATLTSSNSSVVVTGAGALWDLNAGTLLFTANANVAGYSNNVTIANGGVVTNVAYFLFSSGQGTSAKAIDCSLVITNGGKLYAAGSSPAGNNHGGAGNKILVGTGGQPSLWDVQNSTLSFFDARFSDCAFNTFTIDANGMVTNALSVVIGKVWSPRSVVGNSLTVRNGGQLWIGGSGLAVGKMYDGVGTTTNNMVENTALITGAGSRVSMTGGGVSLGLGKATYNSTNNTLTIADGGLLEAVGTITVAGTTANNVSNKLTVTDGGILQFTVAMPTITINNFDASSGNGMLINNGTLSFRGITSGTLPNLTNNLAKSGGFSTNNIAWLGKNSFRLDSSSGTNSVAGGYVFEDNGKAYNYVGLELVNGATALRGSGVTIGASGGSALFSNTTATVGCTFTNNGTLTVANSAVTFSSDLTLGSGCAVNVVSTNQMPMTVSGTLKADGGTVSLPASLGKTDGFALFTSPNVIAGTVKNMTLSSPMHQLVLTEGGKTLVVLPRKGTMISIF